MTDEHKKPEKIDVTEFLEEECDADAGAGEVELLDPSTGAPMDPAVDAPVAGEASTAALAAAVAERQKYYDLWVRSRADFENFKKRIDRERDEERAQAGSSLIKEILPALDNLERALAGAPTGEPFREGVALIHRQLVEALTHAGLEPIDSIGAVFDPVYHEAVLTERTDRFEPNRVLEEIQRGYLFRGRVLRPALVKVSIGGQTREGAPGAADRETGGSS